MRVLKRGTVGRPSASSLKVNNRHRRAAVVDFPATPGGEQQHHP